MREDCDKNGHSCSTCLNYQFNKEKRSLECTIKSEKVCRDSCFDTGTLIHWKQDNPLSIGKYACLKSQEIFGKLKAKIFNVLEAQIPFEPGDRKLTAAKRLTEDIISLIAEDVKNAILKSEISNKTINM
jgi:hypothetical protein